MPPPCAWICSPRSSAHSSPGLMIGWAGAGHPGKPGGTSEANKTPNAVKLPLRLIISSECPDSGSFARATKFYPKGATPPSRKEAAGDIPTCPERPQLLSLSGGRDAVPCGHGWGILVEDEPPHTFARREPATQTYCQAQTLLQAAVAYVFVKRSRIFELS